MARRLQIAFAAACVAVMIFVLIGYVREDHRAPSSSSGATAPLPGEPIVATGDTRPAPLELYAKSQLGDWNAFTNVTASGLGTFHSTAIQTIAAATDKMITTSFRGHIEETGETRDERGDDYPRAGLTLERLVGLDIGGWTVLGASVIDDNRTVGGRTFHCKKITFTSKDPMFPTKKTRTELWISSEVPGAVIEKHEIQDLDDKNIHFDMHKTMIGFGTATVTTWGSKPTF